MAVTTRHLVPVVLAGARTRCTSRSGPTPPPPRPRVERLQALPPLVFAGEARQLQAALGEVAAGRAFLLQAGDCAESFHDFTAVTIREKLKILLQMAAVLTYGAALPVVKVGRIAGQFAKPRSVADRARRTATSCRPSAATWSTTTRRRRGARPDPERMLQGYHQSAATLNLVRAFTKGGFADLTQVHMWNQEFVASSPRGPALRGARRRDRARARASWPRAASTSRTRRSCTRSTSGRATRGSLLDYEEGLTRRDSLTGDWYDCSAHMLWIGERTRQPDGAHVEFFSGVHNPLGVKLGPTATRRGGASSSASGSTRERIPGRLTLIVAHGRRAASRELLPPLLRAVREAEQPGRLGVRPDARERLHDGGRDQDAPASTRSWPRSRASSPPAARRASGPAASTSSSPARTSPSASAARTAVLEEQLTTRYETLCDPRLNARQSLDLAFRVAELMRR